MPGRVWHDRTLRHGRRVGVAVLSALAFAAGTVSAWNENRGGTKFNYGHCVPAKVDKQAVRADLDHLLDSVLHGSAAERAAALRAFPHHLRELFPRLTAGQREGIMQDLRSFQEAADGFTEGQRRLEDRRVRTAVKQRIRCPPPDE